jgi:hypothetical protein
MVGERVPGLISSRMKIKPKMRLVLGALVTAAFQAWKACRIEKFERSVSCAYLVMVREQSHFSISAANGRSL